MLPRSRRLSARQLDRLFKTKHRVSVSPGKGFLVRYLDTGSKNELSSFAFAVPNKVARSSVARHQIKRRSLAALRALLPKVVSGFWIAGWCRPEGVEFSLDQWREDWQNCLKQNKLLV